MGLSRLGSVGFEGGSSWEVLMSPIVEFSAD